MVALSAGCTDTEGDDDPLSDPTNPYVGLVAWWPLDADAADVSGNGYDGLITGASPTADRHGDRRGAMAFDTPRDHIEVPIMGELGDQMTVSFWALTKTRHEETFALLVDNQIVGTVPPTKGDVWQHIMVVYTADRVTRYVDGEKVSEAPRAGGSFRAGRTWHLGHPTFKGILDDVRVYDHAMTYEEMAAKL